MLKHINSSLVLPPLNRHCCYHFKDWETDTKHAQERKTIGAFAEYFLWKGMGDTWKTTLQNRNKYKRKVCGLGIPHTERHLDERTVCSSPIDRKINITWWLIPMPRWERWRQGPAHCLLTWVWIEQILFLFLLLLLTILVLVVILPRPPSSGIIGAHYHTWLKMGLKSNLAWHFCVFCCLYICWLMICLLSFFLCHSINLLT